MTCRHSPQPPCGCPVCRWNECESIQSETHQQYTFQQGGNTLDAALLRTPVRLRLVVMLLWLELSSIAPSAENPATAQYGLHICHMRHVALSTHHHNQLQ